MTSLRRRSILLGALAAPLVARHAGAQAATEVRFGTWAREGEAQYISAQRFKEVLEQGSNGRFRVSIFGGNQLGTPAEMLAQLALNTTQVMASGDPGIRQIEYLALPYLMRGLKNHFAVLGLPEAQQWQDELVRRRRVRLLGFQPRNPRQISANKVINTIEDLRGLKLRSPEQDYYVQSLTALGARPTPMAFSEVYQALQLGVVDGQENPIETIWASKFFEVQKCVAMVDYIDKPAYVMIGERFWNGLSAADKDLVRRAQSESQAAGERVMAPQAEEVLGRFRAAGVAVTYPPKAPFVAATQAVRDRLGTQIWGAELYRRIVEIGQRQIA
ncbi:MAG: TRAP transporter substrate-binding protein [Alphaproteobacteria bacterium]|nr:TRAP transporter substrate-binding protein [Alphaproteobacteria bacterium]